MPSTLLDKTQEIPHNPSLSKGEAEGRGIKTSQFPALLAAVLGLALLYAAGFSDIAPLHNAAHDGRHSASFPCH